MVYHVLNRGNGRRQIFRAPGDYQAFAELMVAGKQRAEVEIFAFCLMPIHWHLVLRPRRDGDLAGYLSWLSNTHVKRYRAQYRGSSGHLYQGRYKSFVVEEDAYLLTLLRYVEANPLRAKLVVRAQDWPWSSLGCADKLSKVLLSVWPVDRPRHWTRLVNEALAPAEMNRLKLSLQRDRPLGTTRWTLQMAQTMGLQYTLNPHGRPRKQREIS